MIVLDRLRKPADDAADGPELHEVNCRVCNKFAKPWVFDCCEQCGKSGKARELEVRLFLEKQAARKEQR